MKKLNKFGFTPLETVLILVAVGIIGFTGWFVWHAKQNTDKSLTNTAKSQPAVTKTKKAVTVTDFASCKAAAGSIMQETYPEQCVTKDGKRFTDTAAVATSSQKYLDVKEWGVKFPYVGTDTLLYKFTSTEKNFIGVTSNELAAKYPGCNVIGAGGISRGIVTDEYGGQTVGQAYQKDPTTFGKIGIYYYWFQHDQAACATNPTTASSVAENAANDFTKAIVPKVVAE